MDYDHHQAESQQTRLLDNMETPEDTKVDMDESTRVNIASGHRFPAPDPIHDQTRSLDFHAHVDPASNLLLGAPATRADVEYAPGERSTTGQTLQWRPTWG